MVLLELALNVIKLVDFAEPLYGQCVHDFDYTVIRSSVSDSS